jgi:hypothetical protein
VTGKFSWYYGSAAVRAAVDPLIKVQNSSFEGDYEGNGMVQVTLTTSNSRTINLIVIPEEFAEFIDDWINEYETTVSTGILVSSEIYCASCYNKPASTEPSLPLEDSINLVGICTFDKKSK